MCERVDRALASHAEARGLKIPRLRIIVLPDVKMGHLHPVRNKTKTNKELSLTADINLPERRGIPMHIAGTIVCRLGKIRTLPRNQET